MNKKQMKLVGMTMAVQNGAPSTPHVSCHPDRMLTWDELMPTPSLPTSREGNGARNGGAPMTAIPKQGGLCACGCGTPVDLDLWHHQKYAPGHGGKALWKRRNDALRTALEALMIVWGWLLPEAIQMVGWWVADRLESAKSIAAKHGYDYTRMAWNG